jgi:hypothetical protein
MNDFGFGGGSGRYHSTVLSSPGCSGSSVSAVPLP